MGVDLFGSADCARQDSLDDLAAGEAQCFSMFIYIEQMRMVLDQDDVQPGLSRSGILWTSALTVTRVDYRTLYGL